MIRVTISSPEYENDKGTPITVDVEFEQYTPHGVWAHFNPDTTQTITITDPAGTDKVDAENLVNSDVGKYYYVVQSAADWIRGIYLAKVNATDGSYTDISINTNIFNLI